MSKNLLLLQISRTVEPPPPRPSLVDRIRRVLHRHVDDVLYVANGSFKGSKRAYKGLGQRGGQVTLKVLRMAVLIALIALLVGYGV